MKARVFSGPMGQAMLDVATSKALKLPLAQKPAPKPMAHVHFATDRERSPLIMPIKLVERSAAFALKLATSDQPVRAKRYTGGTWGAKKRVVDAEQRAIQAELNAALLETV